jgi:hypothetical protein
MGFPGWAARTGGGGGRRGWLWILGVAVVVCAVWVASRSGRSDLEPYHGGRWYSEWLDRAPGSRPENIEAQAAIAAIGTNAIPFLLEEATYVDPPASARLAQRLRSFNLISIGLEPWWNDSRKRAYRARLGISHLVSRQIDIAPTLFWMLRRTELEARRVVSSVDETLMDREVVQPAFWAGMREFLADPDEKVRRRGVAFLGAGFGVVKLDDPAEVRQSMANLEQWSGYRAWVALPGLGVPPATAGEWVRAGLVDPGVGVRWRAASAVRWHGTNVGDVVPTLELALAREAGFPRDPNVNLTVAMMTNLMTLALERAKGGPAK